MTANAITAKENNKLLEYVPAGYRDTVSRLLNASMSANTRTAYEKQLRAFFAFCGGLRVYALPADAATVTAISRT